MILARAVSLAGSLAADAILVVIGTTLFSSTRDYVHFQFHDYAKLTIIGVVIACLAWPVVTRHRGHAGLPGPDPSRYAGRGM